MFSCHSQSSSGTLLYLSLITAPRGGYCAFMGEGVRVQKSVNTYEESSGAAGLCGAFHIQCYRPT